MFPPFSQELARHYCQRLISQIEKGEVKLVQTGRQSQERKGQGLMIGSLICWDKASSRRIVLYAVSGNNKELKSEHNSENYIFVPSVVSSEKIDSALEENDLKIHELTDQINKLTLVNKTSAERASLINERTTFTDASLKKVFSLYSFTRFDGNKITLNEIIQKHGGRLPPTGTGDCCAPKLLNYAFSKGLMPISMDEIYYGPDTANKKGGISYSPCDERCGYILPSILGIEILYRDTDIVVINKEPGLLSVPGRGEDKSDCAESRLRFFFPDAPRQPAVHRLDMETSGILVLALNSQAHKKLNEEFAEGKIHKKYIALLDGILRGKPQGRTELPFRLDPDNRPHQIYDKENGKLGITEWRKIGVENIQTNDGVRKVTRIEFSPITGRTHQLRLAASCPVELGGLGLPIAGDSLYGKKEPYTRLMLHAAEIEFFHPTSGRLMHITCRPDF